MVKNEHFEQCPPRTWFSGFIGWAVVHGQYGRVTASILRLFLFGLSKNIDVLITVWHQPNLPWFLISFDNNWLLVIVPLRWHYQGMIMIRNILDYTLIQLGFVILWRTGSLVSWLSRFVLKIYSGDLTFKIVFATVALLALFDDHVAWVWISLNLGNSDTFFLYSVEHTNFWLRPKSNG